MIFIIGGAYQGKLDFAVSLWKSLHSEAPRLCTDFHFGRNTETDIVPDLHLFIKKRLEELSQPEQKPFNRETFYKERSFEAASSRLLLEEILALRARHPDIIFTMAELGCGVVPISAKDRMYREICGRISCVLAMLAEKTYQVTCGISSLLAEHDILTIALIRHGKTKGNEEKRYIGRTDESLSENGRKELKHLFYRSFLKPDIIFSSPMKRCQETAAILFPEQILILSGDFRETDFGKFEGKNCDELNHSPELSPLWQKWIDSNGTLPFPDGESPEEFSRRTTKCFSETITRWIEISQTGNSSNCAAFILHGGSIMALLDTFVPKDYFHRHDSFYSWQVTNGDGYLLFIDKKEWLFGKQTVYPIGKLHSFISYEEPPDISEASR